MKKEVKELLESVANLHSIPQGAFSLRENGKGAIIQSTDDIIIEKRSDNKGIKVIVKDNTKNKSVHLPVVITKSGITDIVYNEFIIGENCDVLIVAGCGIHNSGKENSTHNGIHTFKVGKNSVVNYVEKHLGIGNGMGEKNLNPTTRVFLKENSKLKMEMVQLGGVNRAERKTTAKLGKNSSLEIMERVLTDKEQVANSSFIVNLEGENSACNVDSRVVAKGDSRQKFVSKVNGKNKCFAHVACDGILKDNAVISSVPEVNAICNGAELVHEAAIGKIAGDQILKLQTLGLTQEEAENQIIKGFLK